MFSDIDLRGSARPIREIIRHGWCRPIGTFAKAKRAVFYANSMREIAHPRHSASAFRPTRVVESPRSLESPTNRPSGDDMHALQILPAFLSRQRQL
jgi:hypothetical protein